MARLLAFIGLTEVIALNNGHQLPALGFSTWNHFGGGVSDALLRELADAMVSSGLAAAGYEYLNLDDGWACCRDANGTIMPDPKLFPNGMKAVADYIHSRGLKMGIYTARGSTTCLGRPGSDSYEVQDAMTYASWGIDFLKEDSCGGTTHGSVWEQYARMRDALNATGRPIYFSITEAVDYPDGHTAMHCYGNSVFTVIPWLQQGLDPTTLANSYLVEYCNNEDVFGYTAGVPAPGGFLSNLDSQALLTYDNLTVPGAFNDNDMLEVCNGGQSTGEYRAQFSAWAILASPLILGNDVRAINEDCLAIITNKEVIAVNQDPLVKRGRLVYQWPAASWPNITSGTGLSTPYPQAALAMAPCNATDPAQAFTYNTSGVGLEPGRGYIQSSTGLCLTYGGYKESNVYLGACVGWSESNIGGQLWNITAAHGGGISSLQVCDNAGKVLDVYNCNVSSPDAVQVCTSGGADCYASSPAPGCEEEGQLWQFDAGAVSAPIVSPINSGQFCMTVAAYPPPPVDIRVQVWAKPLVDGSVAALAFNRSPLQQSVNITWDMLGIPSSSRANVSDLWTGAWAVYEGQYSAAVQPHDVAMVRVKAL